MWYVRKISLHTKQTPEEKLNSRPEPTSNFKFTKLIPRNQQIRIKKTARKSFELQQKVKDLQEKVKQMDMLLNDEQHEEIDKIVDWTRENDEEYSIYAILGHSRKQVRTSCEG